MLDLIFIDLCGNSDNNTQPEVSSLVVASIAGFKTAGAPVFI